MSLKLFPIGLFCLFIGTATPALSYSLEKAGFTISVKNLQIPYREFSVFAKPGETLKLEITGENSRYEFSIETSLQHVKKKQWSWDLSVPSKTGRYPVTVIRRGTNSRISLNIFAMVPASAVKNEHLNGYRIGRYPKIVSGKPYVTIPPSHFIEVGKEILDVSLSPHFKVKQFLCKQQGDFPKYLVLDEVLILKLEMILEEVNNRGYSAETFHIMSGYRTPYYNKAIGNVDYSRHLWGKAADIFIDQNPVDDRMDDINKDGVVDKKDAEFLYDIVDSLVAHKWYQQFIGGLGYYESNASHGPFVHVDSRGYKARW